jgi:hypothetical protein
MVPEEHELVLPGTPALRDFFKSAEFENEVRRKLQAQYEVHMLVRDDAVPVEGEADVTEERLVMQYTRNNAGGLKDAIDFVVARLVPHGLDEATVKGAIPRPKSDSFENSLPFFNSKLLQHAPPPLVTDSPTRSTFGDDISDRSSLFDKLRKPGSISSISSFLDRRKNNHSSSSNSLFKHASSNASKASLVSMESRDSGYRNPWGDSTVNLTSSGPGLSGLNDEHDGHAHPMSSTTSLPVGTPGTSGPNGWPHRSFHESQSAIAPLSSTAASGGGSGAGDSTPTHYERPATAHSLNGVAAGLGVGMGMGGGQAPGQNQSHVRNHSGRSGGPGPIGPPAQTGQHPGR